MEIKNQQLGVAEITAMGGLALSNVPKRIDETEKDEFVKFVGSLKVVPAKEAPQDRVILTANAVFYTLTKSRRILVKDAGVVYVVNSVLTHVNPVTQTPCLAIERVEKEWEKEKYLAWK